MKNIISIILTTFILSIPGYSQNTFDNITYTTKYLFTGEIVNEYDSVFAVQVLIKLDSEAQADDISKIYVKTVSSDVPDNTIDNIFDLNDLGSLDEGLTYNQTGNLLTLGVGENTPPVYVVVKEVAIEDNQGEVSEPLDTERFLTY